jgi:hypothetical protein
VSTAETFLRFPNVSTVLAKRAEKLYEETVSVEREVVLVTQSLKRTIDGDVAITEKFLCPAKGELRPILGS